MKSAQESPGASGSATGSTGGHAGWRALAAEVWHGVPHLLLLTFIVVILHGWHLHDLQATEAHFRNEALRHRQLASDDGASLGMERRQAVRVLELSSRMRVRELEPAADAIGDAAIDRLDGQRPLDRCKTAGVLAALTERLAALPEGPPKVVAIDFDVAPVGATDAAAASASRAAAADPPADCTQRMAEALHALRKVSAVVAIVLPHQAQAGRQARNAFWVQRAGCSRNGAIDGQQHPLFLASPLVFHDHAGPPLDFPYRTRDADQHAAFGRLFPSVGNLADLALHDTKGPAPAEGTALCDQMARAPATACTLEDGLQADLWPEPAACQGQDLRTSPDIGHARMLDRVGQLELKAYNWLLRDRLAGNSALDSRDQLARRCSAQAGEACISDDVLAAEVLMVSVDAGGGRDTYQVPNITPDPVTGGELHALQFLSLQPGQGLDTHSYVGVVTDLGAGLLFLVAWVVLRSLLVRLQGTPALTRTALTLVPLVLVLAAAWLIRTELSPRMMGHGHWVNPLFVLVGLALHAYAEAWHGVGHGGGGSAHAPDFSFGMARLFATWRDGASVAGWADAGVPAVLQWLVLVGGMSQLVGRHGVHGGWWIVVPAALVCLFGAGHHWHDLTAPHHPAAPQATSTDQGH